ncbi:MAG: NUDIX hydrolase [Candidatus Sumerlaeaceae bacterium]
MTQSSFDGNNPHEILAIVDADDCELGGEARHVVHSTGLLHRAVHVFVFGRDGRLLLQQRSELKDTYPLHWECVGGHLSPGESYDSAASREVEEELGVSPGELIFLRKLTACSETGQEFVQVYRTVIEVEPHPNPDEVIAVHWFTLYELRNEIATQSRAFSPSLLHSLEQTGLLSE